ncbi:MAG: hypothetical protein GX259_06255 [Bacteroidales bacterium]|nr:hypothetical protein [Bacteroidales bacterium]
MIKFSLKQLITIFLVLIFNVTYSQSKSVFDANYFRNDNFEPPLRAGKGFNITDVYKQTKFCFTPETSNPSKLVRTQNSGKTSISIYYTKTEKEYKELKNLGFSGKVSYLNLFSLGGSKLTEWAAKSDEKVERLIFSAKIDFGNFEYEADPVLNPEAKSLIDNKQFNDFINLYGTHYISGVRKEAYIWVIVTKTESDDSSSFTDQDDLDANIGQFGRDFEVKNKNQTEQFFSNGTFEAEIEIHGPILDKISLENQISPLLSGNSDVSNNIKQIISNSISNISDPEQAIITQYYFSPFTLYGVDNIIWNLKKENQLIKINENVLNIYSTKNDIDEFIAPNAWSEFQDDYDDIFFDFSEKEKYKKELQNTFNSILPNLKLYNQSIELTLKNLEKAYNSCSDIQCNPDINCCNLGDLETKVQELSNKVQIEIDKFENVVYEAMDAYLDEEFTPDCQKNNQGVLTIVNKSSNPYLIYQNGNYIGEIAGKGVVNLYVNLGTTKFKAEQKSGYLLYATINNRTVEFNEACQELTITVGEDY